MAVVLDVLLVAEVSLHPSVSVRQPVRPFVCLYIAPSFIAIGTTRILDSSIVFANMNRDYVNTLLLDTKPNWFHWTKLASTSSCLI